MKRRGRETGSEVESEVDKVRGEQKERREEKTRGKGTDTTRKVRERGGRRRRKEEEDEETRRRKVNGGAERHSQGTAWRYRLSLMTCCSSWSGDDLWKRRLR